MKKLLIILFVLSLALISCEEDNEILPPPDPGYTNLK